ncbi:MAG: hypothetical protein FWB98_00555 [Defluviitaleaceae bacterium]|nr:hypothetical protein [Defluviitaleaceae bacterium]
MKKIVILTILTLCSLVVFAGCGGYASDVVTERSYASFDYMSFSEIGQIFTFAPHVARVQILDERSEMVDIYAGEFLDDPYLERYAVFTIYRFQVMEVFRGNMTAGEAREVWRMGGKIEGVMEMITPTNPLPVGEEIVLFLHDNSNGKAYPMQLSNPSQSAYLITPALMSLSAQEDGLISAFEAGELMGDETLVSLDHNNQLTLTLGDLIRLSNND